jgi:hypothetical protein
LCKEEEGRETRWLQLIGDVRVPYCGSDRVFIAEIEVCIRSFVDEMELREVFGVTGSWMDMQAVGT